VENLKNLLPIRAVEKLKKSKGKKFIIVSGEPGLLKSEVIEKFIEDEKLKNKKFLLTSEDRNSFYFLSRIEKDLTKGSAESIGGMKSTLSNYFREETEIKIFVFERFEEIISSESMHIFWDLTLNSNPEISIIIETREDIRTPLESQTERIGRELLLLTEEDIINFLEDNNIKYLRKDIEKILRITGGHGFFTRLFLSEYIEKGKITETSEFELVERILKERFESLKPETKSLLMGISCLERFNKEELSRILGIREPDEFLAEITKKFIFIEKTENYYYLNQLFRNFLQREMEKHPRGLILKKWILDNAVEFYLEKEDYFQALFYLERLGFYSKILDILRKKFFDITETSRALEIGPVIERLPEEIKNKNFLIILLKAQICLLTHDFDGILKELEKIKPEKLEPDFCAYYYYLKGAGNYYKSKYKEAEEFAKKGFECGERLEERVRYRLNNLLGAINSMEENLEEAEKFYNEAMKVAKNIRISKRAMALLLTNMGSINFRKGNYTLAERMYKEALSITEDADMRAYTLGWLAQVSFYRGDIEKALNLLDELKLTTEKSGTEYYLNSYYSLLRDYEVFKEDLERAKYFNDKLKELFEVYKDPELIIDVKSFDAYYELKKGNPEKALKIINELKPRRKVLKSEKNVTLGKIYTALNELEKAERYFVEAFMAYPECSFRRKIEKIPYFLFLYYKKDYEKATQEFKDIKRIPEISVLLFSLRFGARTFPFKLDENEIIEFLKRENLI